MCDATSFNTEVAKGSPENDASDVNYNVEVKEERDGYSVDEEISEIVVYEDMDENKSVAYLDLNDFGTTESNNVEKMDETNYGDQLNSQETLWSIPCLHELQGDYKFKLIPFSNSCNLKSKWIFSTSLNKLFIDVNRTVIVKLQLDFDSDEDLNLKIMPVFTSPDSINKAVERCIIHRIQDDPECKSHENPANCGCSNYNYACHLVRFATKDKQFVYQYDKLSNRHFLSLPLKDLPASMKDINYEYSTIFSIPLYFTCYSSCLDRRPVVIVFTLEKDGIVVGRSILDIKLSSSPRRDMEKLEAKLQKNVEDCNKKDDKRQCGETVEFLKNLSMDQLPPRFAIICKFIRNLRALKADINLKLDKLEDEVIGLYERACET